MANILDAKKNMDSFNVVLLDPQRLLPTEEFIEERVIQIEQDIIREGRWLKPILVERTSLIIMDGHHRREFARRHSLRRVPCLLLDYSQVELSSWRDEFDLHPEEVIARGCSAVYIRQKRRVMWCMPRRIFFATIHYRNWS